MAEAVKNATGPAAETFRSLGVAVTDAEGALRPTSDVITDLAAAFAGMEDGPAKTAVAMQLLGKSGRDMVPLLNEGADGLAKLKAEAEDFGQVFSAETGAAADQFNDNMDKLRGAFANIAADLTEQLLPHLADFSQWLVENGPAIGQFVGDMVDLAAAVVKAAGAIGSFVAEVGAKFRTLVADMTAAVKALPVQFRQLGADIMSGLWEGLKSKAGSVLGVVGDTARSIISIFQRETKTQSPSRVFAGIGRDLMAGLQQGIQSGQGGVGAAMQGFASDLGGSFVSGFDGAVSRLLGPVLSGIQGPSATR
jgi:hypothetical protein